MADHPDKTKEDVQNILSDMWNKLGTQEKESYTKNYQIRLEVYKERMQQWKARHPEENRTRIQKQEYKWNH